LPQLFGEVLKILERMAARSVNVAKRLKAVGSYDESQIAIILSQFTEEDQAKLSVLTAEVMSRLEKLNTLTNRSQPKQKKKLPSVTKEQKLIAVVSKIRQALDAYGSGETSDVWKIEFQVVLNYNEIEIEQLKVLHQDLVSSAKSTDEIKLLIYVERGRMYDSLKFSETRGGLWEQFCKDMSLCPKTLNRYIDFSRIVSAYPRILICGLSFETIMGFYKELHDYLITNQDLALRLQAPLRTTIVEAPRVVITGHNLPSGADPPETLLSANADWSEAWEITDKIEEEQ